MLMLLAHNCLCDQVKSMDAAAKTSLDPSKPSTGSCYLLYALGPNGKDDAGSTSDDSPDADELVIATSDKTSTR